MRDWGHARGRMESENARKKEHLNIATNFGQARGWKRTCWKSKNHNIEEETLQSFLNAYESEDPPKLTSAQKEEIENMNYSQIEN